MTQTIVCFGVSDTDVIAGAPNSFVAISVSGFDVHELPDSATTTEFPKFGILWKERDSSLLVPG